MTHEFFELLTMANDGQLIRPTTEKQNMNTKKIDQSSNNLIAIAIEESTLSDGSKVYGVRFGHHLFDCVCQKDAERAFLCFEKGIAIIEGNLKMAELEVK